MDLGKPQQTLTMLYPNKHCLPLDLTLVKALLDLDF
jgi:hypothetical protein